MMVWIAAAFCDQMVVLQVLFLLDTVESVNHAFAAEVQPLGKAVVRLYLVRRRRDVLPQLRIGVHDPRAEARRTEAVLDPSAVGGVHEAAGQRDAVVTRDRTQPGTQRLHSD